MISKVVIAVDFDGTLCVNKFPHIGEPNEELIDKLKAYKSKGDVELILWTCREDELLNDAIQWCENLGLVFDAHNENTQSRKEHFGNSPRKVGADIYIDDKAYNPTEYSPAIFAWRLDNIITETSARLKTWGSAPKKG